MKQLNIDEWHDPYVIFGHGAKYFSVEPFLSLLHHFNSTLFSNNVRYIFAIGYSFFDPYINNLLFGAAKGDKRLIIVNPSIPQTNLFRYRPQDGRIAYDENNHCRALYAEGRGGGDLANYFGAVQSDVFLSELPEFNYNRLRAANFDYIPLTTEEFLRAFFGEGGTGLLRLAEDLDQAVMVEDEPF